MKRSNIERHSKTHTNEFKKIPASESGRMELFKIYKDRQLQQSDALTMSLNRTQIIALASFKVVEILIRRQQPFIHGQLVKQIIEDVMSILLMRRSDKEKILRDIRALQLSRKTVVRRLEDIAYYLHFQIKQNIKNAKALSICLDESTDRNNISQLIVWARYVDHNLQAHEEILSIEPMHDTTKAADIFSKLSELLSKFEINFTDLRCVTTDGAPAMVGKINGLIGRIKNENPNLLNLKCIIHQENLSSKFGIRDAKPFSNFVMSIINRIILFL